MQPNSDNNTQDPNRGQIVPPQRDYNAHHGAVADLTRGQIDAIYQKQAVEDSTAAQSQQSDEPHAESAYERTHSDQHQVTESEWTKYHTSWQQYYQQYYERYYVGAVQDAHTKLRAHAEQLQAQVTTQQPSQTISQSEAVNDLRGELLAKVKTQGTKLRKSRHFIPIISAVSVLIIFVFLQYNSMLMAYAVSYVSPGNVDPQNIIVNPNLSLKVDPAPRLIIPKINVDIAVDYTAKPDNNSQMAAMKSSVAYFGVNGANSKPGQLGNVPIAGHSSNDFTDTGSAKFIFARLEQLKEGDIFYLNYEGTRYTYTITKKQVVKPTSVAALQIGTDKPMATLITCVPLGTANNRLLVFGEQISPSPSTAEKSSGGGSSETVEEMAGTAPTAIERLFGAR